MKKILFFLFLSFSTYLHAQQALRHLDATLDSIFGHYNIGEKPGVSLAIIENNKPIFCKSYGHANLEYQIKNTSNTLFAFTRKRKKSKIKRTWTCQSGGLL